MSKLREIRISNITKIIQEPGLDWEKEYLKKLVEKTNDIIKEVEIKKTKCLTQTEINYYKKQFENINEELYMLRFLINISEGNNKIFLVTITDLQRNLNKMLIRDEWIV